MAVDGDQVKYPARLGATRRQHRGFRATAFGDRWSAVKAVIRDNN